MENWRIRKSYKCRKFRGYLKKELIVFRSVCISFTQVIHQHVVIGGGILGVTTVGLIVSIAAPLMIVYFQSTMFGKLADLSENFCQIGKNLVPRRAFYRKFVYSCQIFYIENAYPFDTFLIQQEHVFIVLLPSSGLHYYIVALVMSNMHTLMDCNKICLNI